MKNIVTKEISPLISSIYKLKNQDQIRKLVKSKIQKDMIRFRTCCADPRASK